MGIFKKRTIVGVSVTPGIGLEMAQIDFETRTVLKYATKPLEYNYNQRTIADLDLFKEALSDLFLELGISKDTEVVLNIPTVSFKVSDYPASLDQLQVTNAIEEELMELPLFSDNEACFSAVRLPNSTMQFNKIAYTAAQKATILEIVMIIKDLGHKVCAIDTSVNSVLNSIIYLNGVAIDGDTNWVMLLVENNCCRVVSLIGRNYIDVFEEKISIGEVLGDAENYSTVINAVNPILKNLPSKFMLIVSKTNVISAEVLSNKIQYSAPIKYIEANNYSSNALLGLAPEVDPNIANLISLDVIAAAIYADFENYTDVHFNLFNEMLGDIYLMEQPPRFGSTVLTNELLLKVFIILAVLIIIPSIIAMTAITKAISTQNEQEQDLNTEIQKIQKFLKDNENISSDLFDEGYEINIGLTHNKNVYSYYSIVGTEIPKKLWLTHLKLGKNTTIEGQADNLESVYAFFRSIKDYNPSSDIKLQKLGLASSGNNIGLSDDGNFDTESLLTTLNADFYEFRISNEPEISTNDIKNENNNNSGSNLPGDLPVIKDTN